MAAYGNGEPDINIGSDVTEVENVAGALSWNSSWIAPIVAITGNTLLYTWARKIQDINPYVTPLMGNVIFLALFINITAIVTYHMKTSQEEVGEIMATGLKTFMPIIILCVFLYSCAPCDDKFVESSTCWSARKKNLIDD